MCVDQRAHVDGRYMSTSRPVTDNPGLAQIHTSLHTVIDTPSMNQTIASHRHTHTHTHTHRPLSPYGLTMDRFWLDAGA